MGFVIMVKGMWTYIIFSLFRNIFKTLNFFVTYIFSVTSVSIALLKIQKVQYWTENTFCLGQKTPFIFMMLIYLFLLRSSECCIWLQFQYHVSVSLSMRDTRELYLLRRSEGCQYFAYIFLTKSQLCLWVI